MYQPITNVQDSAPDYLVGFDKGQPVLVPALSILQIQASDFFGKKHNGKICNMTAALTMTMANGLGVFSTLVIPPSAGVVTLTPVNGATFNGSTASLTRSLASNPAGFPIVPLGGDAYGVGGTT